MKAEERHELRENDLAGWLQFGLWGFVRQYGSYILLVAALGFLGYTLWQRHQATKVAERNSAFVDYYNSVSQQSADDPFKVLTLLPDMVDNSPYPEIKVLAALELAKDYNLIAADNASQEKLKMSRAEALSKAYEMYNKALEVKGDDPLVAGKAHLGIAAIYEDQGEWDKAAAEYKKITDDSKFAGPIADLAKALSDKSRIDALRSAPKLLAYVPPAPASAPIMPEQPSTPVGGDLLNPGTFLPNPNHPTTSSSSTPMIGPTLGPTSRPGLILTGPGMNFNPYPLTPSSQPSGETPPK